MNTNETKFEILINGRPVHEYYHDGKYFIEGRRGHEYTLRATNYTSKRKKIVGSVDGLNIMTGDSTWERGYVINPGQTIEIPGWRKDDKGTAGFEFGSIVESYNEHNTAGHVSNVGVIGARLFDEHIPPNAIPRYVNPVYPTNRPINLDNNYRGITISADGGQFYSKGGGSWSGYVGGGGTTSSMSAPTGMLGNMPLNSMGSINTLNAGQSWTEMNTSASPTIAMASLNNVTLTPEPVQQELGTKWGAHKEFRTVDVYIDFHKSPTDVFVLYYDTKRGLIRRGINLQEYRYSPNEPNPFPTDGCPAPIRK